MKKREKVPQHDRFISATELAQMARCEKLMVFEDLHGSRISERQQQAMKRGLIEHEKFYREGLAATSNGVEGKGRRFISICVLGAFRLTQVFRQFRDLAWRRRFIWLYYRLATCIGVFPRRWYALQQPVRTFLGMFAKRLRQWSGRDGGGA